jgi:hypothetical protein
VDAGGTSMLQGGGNVLLSGNALWSAPGGGTAYTDPVSGDMMLAFHAINMQDTHYQPTLWLRTFSWANDWPSLQ